MKSLLDWRAEFPILSTCTYLISNSLGAMPRAVYDQLHTYADTWATLGVRAWGQPFGDHPTWWELKGAVGDQIAPLMGAPAKSVLIHENASIANSILISALDFSDHAAQQSRHQRPGFPVGCLQCDAQSAAGDGGADRAFARGHHHRHPGITRRHRRANAAGQPESCAVSQRLHPARRRNCRQSASKSARKCCSTAITASA